MWNYTAVQSCVFPSLLVQSVVQPCTRLLDQLLAQASLLVQSVVQPLVQPSIVKRGAKVLTQTVLLDCRFRKSIPLICFNCFMMESRDPDSDPYSVVFCRVQFSGSSCEGTLDLSSRAMYSSPTQATGCLHDQSASKLLVCACIHGQFLCVILNKWRI